MTQHLVNLKVAFLLVPIVVLYSCSSNNNSDKKIHENSKTNNLLESKIVFHETQVLKSGDSILVFGGNEEYLKKVLGKDSCLATVLEIYFSKPLGQVAIIDFELDSVKNKSYSIDLYYMNSSDGYTPSKLRIFDEILTEEHHGDGLGPNIGAHYIDQNVGFNINK